MKIIKPIINYIGNKSLYMKYIIKILDKLENYNNYLFLDCFGGSGVISQYIRDYYIDKHKPIPRIVFNDFDNYSDKISLIPETNKLYNKIRDICKYNNYKRNEKITPEDKQKIDKFINENVDIEQLSHKICYCFNIFHNVEDIKAANYYWRMPKNNNKYIPIYEYYNNITIESMDYLQLINKYKEIADIEDKELFLILDPPYISTEQTQYNNKLYNTLKDCLKILDLLHDNKFVFFESEKSNILNIMLYINNIKENYFNFDYFTTIKRTKQTGGSYDYIIYNI